MDLKCAFLLGKYNSTNGWTWYDLEHSTSINTSSGKVRYRKFDGLEKEGEASNIYTESYADSDVLRVSEVGENIHRKSTNLVLDLMFFGDDRNTVKDNLLQILEADGGITVYWDNIRRKCAVLLFKSAIEPKEDVYVAGIPRSEYELNFTSLTGKTSRIDITYSDVRNISTTSIETYALPIIMAATT